MTADKEIDALIELQKIDDGISQLDKLLISLPSEITSLSSSLDTAKKEAELFHENLKEADKLRLAKEREVEDRTAAIAKSRGKLNDVKTNVEYKAVLAEIENIHTAISTLEDEQLALMEEVDGSKAEGKKITIKLEEEEKKFKLLKSENESEIEKVKMEKEAALSRKKELASSIEPELLREYEKIIATRDRKALSELIDGYCTACHTSVLPQLALEIRTGASLHTCHHCQRFLFVAKQAKSGNNINGGKGGQTAAGSLSGSEESPDTVEQGTP